VEAETLDDAKEAYVRRLERNVHELAHWMRTHANDETLPDHVRFECRKALEFSGYPVEVKK